MQLLNAKRRMRVSRPFPKKSSLHGKRTWAMPNLGIQSPLDALQAQASMGHVGPPFLADGVWVVSGANLR